MTSVAAIDFLAHGCRALGVSCQPEALARLGRYYEELCRWNRKTNLVSARATPEALLELHFLDSLTLLPVVDEQLLKREHTRLLDIGSGAGFPGLVLAAARPALSVHLVEPRAKRALFLRHMTRTLAAKNTRVHEKRCEELPQEYGNSFHVVTARAVGRGSWLLEAAQPFLSQDGVAVRMLGGKEEEAAGEIPAGFKGTPREKTFTLPVSGQRRRLLLYSLSAPVHRVEREPGTPSDR